MLEEFEKKNTIKNWQLLSPPVLIHGGPKCIGICLFICLWFQKLITVSAAEKNLKVLSHYLLKAINTIKVSITN